MKVYALETALQAWAWSWEGLPGKLLSSCGAEPVPSYTEKKPCSSWLWLKIQEEQATLWALDGITIGDAEGTAVRFFFADRLTSFWTPVLLLVGQIT